MHAYWCALCIVLLWQINIVVVVGYYGNWFVVAAAVAIDDGNGEDCERDVETNDQESRYHVTAYGRLIGSLVN